MEKFEDYDMMCHARPRFVTEILSDTSLLV